MDYSALQPPLLLLLTASLLVSLATPFGINYGQLGNNLPRPSAVVPLVKSIGVTSVKLYDADPDVLKSFANTGIEFIVSVPNEQLSAICDPARALSWVKSNVQCYLPSTKITTIAVGNEVLTSNDSTLSSNLLPAMQNVQTALKTLNLDKQVMATTAHNLGILEVSYPPSSGVFRKDLMQKLTCILDFHSKVGSPFLINAYPFFAYRAEPKHVDLNFVLFEGPGIEDPVTGLHYDNMFLAQIDAAHWAMDKIGYKNVCLQVSETGWPSKGDDDEPGATPDNARKYNAGVLQMIAQKKGTPMRPNLNLNIHVFALFNENQKPGPTSERNFGLFKPDGTPVYDLGFKASGLGSGSSPKTGGGGGGDDSGGSGVNTPAVFSPPSDGYLSIDGDDAERLSLGGLLSLMCLVVSAFVALRL